MHSIGIRRLAADLSKVHGHSSTGVAEGVRRVSVVGLRAGLLVVSVFCMYLAVRQGVAAWYFRTGVPATIQKAIRWDPGDPQYFDALANVQHMYADTDRPDEIIHLYETATRLSPRKAQYWSDLGAAYDWSGRPDKAQQAFERALQLFPSSPELNWQMANFDIRRGKVEESLHSLRKVLLGGSVPRKAVFALASNTSTDNSTILNRVIPQRSDILIDYLDFQIENGNMDAAEQTWGYLLNLKLPFDVHESFLYLDELIHHRKIDALEQAWKSLDNRFPAEVPPLSSDGNQITNGGFETAILNGGLDWRVMPANGVTVSLDEGNHIEGHRSLRIDFDGTRNLDYGNVLQFVLVEPLTQYEFQGYMRVEGITSDSGPRFEIYDAYDMRKLFLSTGSLVGTSGWSPLRLKFRTGPDTRLLIVRIGRPLGQEPDDQISGSVWADNLSLTQAAKNVDSSKGMPNR